MFIHLLSGLSWNMQRLFGILIILVSIISFKPFKIVLHLVGFKFSVEKTPHSSYNNILCFLNHDFLEPWLKC